MEEDCTRATNAASTANIEVAEWTAREDYIKKRMDEISEKLASRVKGLSVEDIKKLRKQRAKARRKRLR